MTSGGVREFYDGFSRDVLARDFAEPNLRIERVRELVDAFVPRGCRVLEAGCGVGILSRHLQDRGCRVVSVDISPQAVDVAHRFAPSGEHFVHDLCADPAPLLARGPFDRILMADVIEHLPAAGRPGVLATLESLLAPAGLLLLAFPSPEYQEHLRAHRPEALQVVDETVELEALLRETRLVPRFFAYRDAWERDQYVHLVLGRRAPHAAEPAPQALGERLRARLARVAWRLRTRGIRRHLRGSR